MFSSNLSNLSPYNVLDRGYALLSNDKKKTISLIEDVKIGDHIYSFLKDGELKMEVINKNVKNNKKR